MQIDKVHDLVFDLVFVQFVYYTIDPHRELFGFERFIFTQKQDWRAVLTVMSIAISDELLTRPVLQLLIDANNVIGFGVYIEPGRLDTVAAIGVKTLLSQGMRQQIPVNAVIFNYQSSHRRCAQKAVIVLNYRLHSTIL